MTIITEEGCNDMSQHLTTRPEAMSKGIRILKVRKPALPRARTWDSFSPEERIEAIREVRRLVLDRLAVSPCGMLALRQQLPDRVAAGLVTTMDALVDVGSVTAIGPGIYALVAEPDGQAVRAAPGRDLVVACLAVTDKRNDVSRYTGIGAVQVGANIAKGIKRGDIGHVSGPRKQITRFVRIGTGQWEPRH